MENKDGRTGVASVIFSLPFIVRPWKPILTSERCREVVKVQFGCSLEQHFLLNMTFKSKNIIWTEPNNALTLQRGTMERKKVVIIVV